jgi:DNA-binding transcriptional LysR family regulator
MAQIDRALRSNLKLRHLQLVVALDEFRHLGRTAEFLTVTQPAISKMLTEVEDMLGKQLFDRSRRGTEPTIAGLAIIRFARSVLAEYERTREEIDALEKGVAGRTKVGFMVVAMPTLLAPAVAQLKSESHIATVLMEEGDLTHLLPKLRLGELDLFVGRLEPGYASPDLLTEALYDEKMCIVVKQGHALSTQRKVTWEDLQNLRFVAPPSWASMRVKFEQQFFKHGLQPPKDIVETASFLGQITFISEQNSAALMAQSVAEHFSDRGLVHIVNLEVPVDVPPVGLITMRDRKPTPITQRLSEIMRTNAQAKKASNRHRKS